MSLLFACVVQFQQSVALAQRVVKYQREALACQQRLETAAREQRALESDVARLRAQLAHVHQPQSYLVIPFSRLGMAAIA